MVSSPKARPIIFDAESVRGILAGRKAQTRRLVSLANSDVPRWLWQRLEWDDALIPARLGPNFVDHGLRTLDPPVPADYLHVAARPGPDELQDDADSWTRWRVYPYIVPGELLWVKEALFVKRPVPRGVDWREVGFCYAADCGDPVLTGKLMQKKSPLFMPRDLCRLTLRVTEVRVQRLQAIGEADAVAEGCESVAAYAARWDAINGKRCPWASNPWVWAISFERVEVGDDC